jgi:hypothetical protein
MYLQKGDPAGLPFLMPPSLAAAALRDLAFNIEADSGANSMRIFFIAGCVLLALQGSASAQQGKAGASGQKLIPRDPLPSNFRKPQPFVIPQGNSLDEQEQRSAIEADDADDDDDNTLMQKQENQAEKRAPKKRNPSAVPPLNRSYQDNPDRSKKPMVHFVYAVPKGGVDYALDLRTVVPYGINSANRWLASQIRRKLRIDTFQGHLDISFVRLAHTDEYYASFGDYRFTPIEQDFLAVFATKPHKKYIVLYEGTSTRSCGEAEVGGITSIIYLRGLENSPFIPCADVPWVSSPTEPPGYHEFALLHEFGHLAGAVSPGAPHYFGTAHVGDTPDDLMYGGTLPWSPSVVDFEHDDYYSRKTLPNGLVNLIDSPVLKKR